MNVTIREMDESNIQFVKTYGSSFEVTSKLVPQAEDGKISYTFVNLPPCIKKKVGLDTGW